MQQRDSSVIQLNAEMQDGGAIQTNNDAHKKLNK